jgi:hypothetical protein
LTGVGGAVIRFAPGQDGVQLSSDNRVQGLELRTDADCCALFNDVSVERIGRLELRNLRTIGLVRILARDAVRSGHVEAHDLDITEADATGYDRRPKGYGVEVVSGVFTLWNQHDDPAIAITADLSGIKAGRPGAPVNGGGVFVSGGGSKGGRLVVRSLETGLIDSDGGITGVLCRPGEEFERS